MAIKPNLTSTKRTGLTHAIVTDPYAVEGFVDRFVELGVPPSSIFVREGLAAEQPTTGYPELASRAGIHYGDDVARTPTTAECPDGVVFRRTKYLGPFGYPDTFVLNVAKHKAHSMGLTLCVKNLQGTNVPPWIRFCGGINPAIGDDFQGDAQKHVDELFEAHLRAGLPRWETAKGAWMEMWAQRTIDHYALIQPSVGLHVIEGIYAQNGDAFDGGPGPSGLPEVFMTNLLVFGRDAFRVDIVGHWLGGHEPGNFGLFHLARERGVSTALDPRKIPVYEWTAKGPQLTRLERFERVPLLTPYLQKPDEDKFHMVDEPFAYPPETAPEALTGGTRPRVRSLGPDPGAAGPSLALEYASAGERTRLARGLRRVGPAAWTWWRRDGWPAVCTRAVGGPSGSGQGSTGCGCGPTASTGCRRWSFRPRWRRTDRSYDPRGASNTAHSLSPGGPMTETFTLVPPGIVPPLDPDFRPAVLANRAYREEVHRAGGVPLVIGLERAEGGLSRFETRVFPDGHPRAAANLRYAERLVKFLLWQRGGWKVYVGGPQPHRRPPARDLLADGRPRLRLPLHGRGRLRPPVHRRLLHAGRGAARARAGPAAGPPPRRLPDRLRPRRLRPQGLRRRSTARPVYSEEVVWAPRRAGRPRVPLPRDHRGAEDRRLEDAARRRDRRQLGRRLHRQPVAHRLALPRHPQGALRRGPHALPPAARRDGRAASTSSTTATSPRSPARCRSRTTASSGVALGSSRGRRLRGPRGQHHRLAQRAGLRARRLPAATRRPTSGPATAASARSYFSQQCVFRLAPRAGIEIPQGLGLAEKLKLVQELLESGHEGARRIWETMGVYMGYGIAHYADFYDLKHVLILGRCTSGRGGEIILDGAREVLDGRVPRAAPAGSTSSCRTRRAGASASRSRPPACRRCAA